MINSDKTELRKVVKLYLNQPRIQAVELIHNRYGFSKATIRKYYNAFKNIEKGKEVLE